MSSWTRPGWLQAGRTVIRPGFRPSDTSGFVRLHQARRRQAQAGPSPALTFHHFAWFARVRQGQTDRPVQPPDWPDLAFANSLSDLTRLAYGPRHRVRPDSWLFRPARPTGQAFVTGTGVNTRPKFVRRVRLGQARPAQGQVRCQGQGQGQGVGLGLAFSPRRPGSGLGQTTTTTGLAGPDFTGWTLALSGFWTSVGQASSSAGQAPGHRVRVRTG